MSSLQDRPPAGHPPAGHPPRPPGRQRPTGPSSGTHLDIPSPGTSPKIIPQDQSNFVRDGGERHQRDASMASVEGLINKDDQAEKGLLASMEHRRQTPARTAGGDIWHASVQGERPPLGGDVPLQFQLMISPDGNGGTPGGSGGHHRKHSGSCHSGVSSRSSTQNSGSAKLADIARRMRQRSGVTPPPPASIDASSSSNNNNSNSHNAHVRGKSRAHFLLDSIQESSEAPFNTLFDGVGVTNNATTLTTDTHDSATGGALELARASTSTETLITGAMHVEELFDEAEAEHPRAATVEMAAVPESEDERLQLSGESVPLMTSSPACGRGYSTGKTVPRSPRLGRDGPEVLRKKSWWRRKGIFWTCCHPLELFKLIWHLLCHRSLLLHTAMPCFVGAAILFYGLYDPKWNYLPGHASIAWWLNFCGRQVVLLDLARAWQWLFIDKFVLGTRAAVRCIGPLLTLCLIQARGWPFTVAAWGFFDLIFLEGSSPFERHWLYFTPFALYSSTAGVGGESNDSGSYLLQSDYYVRLLLSMMLSGFATAAKRTAVAMYFGRRTFVEFKPRLERLLKDVVLVTEMAALAEEAEIAAAEDEQQKMLAARNLSRGVLSDKGSSKVNFLGDVHWSNRPRRSKADAQKLRSESLPVNFVSEDVPDSDEDGKSDYDDESDITTQNDTKADAERLDMQKSNSLHDILDDWTEPINKMKKTMNATAISDILRFRRALTFMDDAEPFGEQFGPASNRKQLIHSAQEVYQRLLKLTPEQENISCEFYDMLSLEDDGEINLGKQKALRKLFRPDAQDELSLSAFVLSCDAIYKKLRYFRANVGNASVIDHALESIVDGAFSFVLVLVVLSVMKFNPWPLLLSTSTLLVSVSFAVGSSASKWFEGMLLVAARRPFDIGDRIYMTEPSLVMSDGLWNCWFVEDINLFHTTIRYAGTNEVATLNNGSISNLRIVNGARSPNAVVWFQFPYRANLMDYSDEGGADDDETRMRNIDKIKAELEKYAKENPREWHSFGYFRVDEVHPDLEKLVVTIGLQHRCSWQDLVPILEAKAKIMCWLMEYSRKLNVIYDELPQRDILYYGGALKNGGVSQHRFQLHNPSNIITEPLPTSTMLPVKQNSAPPSPPSPVMSLRNNQAPAAPESPNTMFLAQVMQTHHQQLSQS